MKSSPATRPPRKTTLGNAVVPSPNGEGTCSWVPNSLTSDSTPDGVSTTEQADTKRGKIDPEVERERYEGAWRTLDEHFKKFWLGIWLFPPVVLVVTAILGRFL